MNQYIGDSRRLALSLQLTSVTLDSSSFASLGVVLF
jgi:hypothetical protein